MPEKFENCPVSVRADGLEREFDRYRDGSGKTYKVMFDRLGALERNQSGLQTRKDSADGKKLDAAVESAVFQLKSGALAAEAA